MPGMKKLNVLLADMVYALVNSIIVIRDTNDESFIKDIKSFVSGGKINVNACGKITYLNDCHWFIPNARAAST